MFRFAPHFDRLCLQGTWSTFFRCQSWGPKDFPQILYWITVFTWKHSKHLCITTHRPHHHWVAAWLFLRMVLMTTVGAVLIDHSKLALVGIAYSTILKSWYPAYLRFNVYWNASMRCQWWDGWNMRAEGWGYDVWRMLKMVEWYEEWWGVVTLVKISGC